MDKPQKKVNDKHTDTHIELRSEKVLERLGEISPALVTWGTVLIAAIFIALLAIVCLVPYPHSQGESIIQHLLF